MNFQMGRGDLRAPLEVRINCVQITVHNSLEEEIAMILRNDPKRNSE